MIHALGLGAYQIGRSHECDFPSSVSKLQVCTRPTFSVEGTSVEIDRLVKAKLSSAASIYEIDSVALRALQPTHVLTQTLCAVCAVSLSDVQAAFEADNGVDARIIPLGATSLKGVWADITQVARCLGVEATGQKLVASLEQRMATVAAIAANTEWRPRVAAIEWLEPIMAAGNWVPELIERAGGENLFGTAGEHSPWMDWKDLRAADPDVIVALPCGFDLARTRREMQALAKLSGWQQLRAARTRNVYLCDGNQFMNRPGPRLVESLQILAEICHPELFSPELRGVGWEQY